MKPAHVYVHLPFCEVICHYCDFYTARAKEARHEDFFRALGLESTKQRELLASPMKAIYLGGGTPSVSPPELLAGFLEPLRALCNEETEITLEANPTNVTEATVRAWRAAGINRLSIGIQSLSDPMLKRLGRVHSAAEARAALEIALGTFANVSGDLIYGVPGQSPDEPASHASAMADLGLPHVSAYHLTLEPSHFLHPKLPSDEAAWEQVRRLAGALGERGFIHYETSNFGRPGFQSRNNQNYWSGGPYLAWGPSAHGFDGDRRRWRNVADWEEYVRRAGAGEDLCAEVEELTLEQRKIETVFTGLRTLAGLDLEDFTDKFGQDLRLNPWLERCVQEGWATLANGRFALTFNGRMLGDEIARKLL